MPLVIPVFIPHEGCSHCCIFCNQNTISGQPREKTVKAADVTQIIEQWLEYSRKKADGNVQVAFYGGSFTGLPFARQRELLGAVKPFLKKGLVHAIRLSTRPDYISSEIISFLQLWHVSIVELGVQSLDDRVLAAARRGHNTSQVVTAVNLLKSAGLTVGTQLMIGLPGETDKSLLQTVDGIVELKPDFVRIYPVLVLQNSPLAVMYHAHQYEPLSLAKAVLKAAWLKQRFMDYGISVVRMGLQPGPELEEALLAGPYHPAFGEMVNARIMFKKIRSLLVGIPQNTKVVLSINEKDQSVSRGLHSANIKRLAELGFADSFVLHGEPGQPRLTVFVRE